MHGPLLPVKARDLSCDVAIHSFLGSRMVCNMLGHTASFARWRPPRSRTASAASPEEISAAEPLWKRKLSEPRDQAQSELAMITALAPDIAAMSENLFGSPCAQAQLQLAYNHSMTSVPPIPLYRPLASLNQGYA